MSRRLQVTCAIAALLALASGPVGAAEFPAPKQADWMARDFRFHTGEVMPEMRVHYTTVGDPSNEPVLVLHGTGGSGTGLLTPGFGGELFGAGQPLDATKYFVILPDAIGAGKSSKPSDGMRAKFPQYDYADMVEAQYRLATEGLGLKRLHLVLGYSMGGMETWLWGEAHPQFMDGLVPMASQPTPMAARNWMLRRLLIESIRQDPEYQGGTYTKQPTSLRLASALFGVATNGGTLALQARGDTHAKADKYVDDLLAATPPADANDFIDQWSASADYDPQPGLGKIVAPLLLINSADDERNPAETGVTVEAMKQVKNGQLYIVPGSAETGGHGTLAAAKLWAPRLGEFMQTLPHRPPS